VVEGEVDMGDMGDLMHQLLACMETQVMVEATTTTNTTLPEDINLVSVCSISQSMLIIRHPDICLLNI
jgi:hypothetical protein